jgi:catechol 2,3-dioxygenase-like lactoylglutathione lyase family enzyme
VDTFPRDKKFPSKTPAFLATVDNETGGPMRPKTNGILESSLYVSDVTRSARFYLDIFGFPVISDFGGRGCALQAGKHQVLLLFKKGASRAITSPHDGDGELHLAFAISSAELVNWESWLQAHGIAVEEKRPWEWGGCSLYFRDPDRHLLEVVTPGTWSVY